MHVLIVGGTGLIGGHAALHFYSLGYNVTIAGRTKPVAPSPLADFAFIKGNYVEAEFTKEQLSAFEVVVFTAGADPRHVPAGEKDVNAYLLRANGEAVPAFAALVRDAGVAQFIHVGSYYWGSIPSLGDTSPYVRSRMLESKGVVALARGGFSATSLCPPLMVGQVSPTAASPLGAELIMYFQGKLGQVTGAPLGGMAVMTLDSLSQALATAIKHRQDVSGKIFFTADENLTYKQFFDYFRRALGMEDSTLPPDESNPMFPRAARFGGNENVFIEPTPETQELFGKLGSHDVYATIKEIVAKRV